MISTTDIDRLLDGRAKVVDRDGEKVGSLSQIYLDDTTGEPSWATVNTGLFGMAESFVPLEGAEVRGDDLRVGYSKDQIKDAPNMDEDQHLELADEERLYEYYAMKGTGRPAQGDKAGKHAKHTDAPRTGQTHEGRRAGDDDSLTLSEERVNVSTETQESGRVRLRKYVVTENVTKTVPVEREEVRIERVPLDEESHGGHIDDDGAEVEVTLHEEKPVVDKDTVAVEEVHLGKETHTEQETVSTDVRKEQLDTDTDGDATAPRR